MWEAGWWGDRYLVMGARILNQPNHAIFRSTGPGAANRWLMFNPGANQPWVILDQYQHSAPFPSPYTGFVEPDS